MNLDSAVAAAGVRLLAFDTLGSTNAEALVRARAGEPGPLWITSACQTAGRGRRGRSFVSERGNLYASLLMTDASPVDRSAGRWNPRDPRGAVQCALPCHAPASAGMGSRQGICCDPRRVARTR